MVTCPEAIAIRRVMERDGITENEVLQRVRNQWPEAEKTPMADFTINNDGEHLLIPQVLEIHTRICE